MLLYKHNSSFDKAKFPYNKLYVLINKYFVFILHTIFKLLYLVISSQASLTEYTHMKFCWERRLKEGWTSGGSTWREGPIWTR